MKTRRKNQHKNTLVTFICNLGWLKAYNTYISMAGNDVLHTVSQTSLNLLQISSNAIKNCVDILLRQKASMKQHLHVNKLRQTNKCSSRS